MVSNLELDPIALPARHPNTPVMPFATPTKKASFIDLSVSIKNGNSTVISFQSYVAPYATLDSRGHAAIKIGDGSDVLDSAQLIADPGHAYVTPQLLVGNNVSIGPGAEVLGPSVIGSYSDSAAPVGIGAGRSSTMPRSSRARSSRRWRGWARGWSCRRATASCRG